MRTQIETTILMNVLLEDLTFAEGQRIKERYATEVQQRFGADAGSWNMGVSGDSEHGYWLKVEGMTEEAFNAFTSAAFDPVYYS